VKVVLVWLSFTAAGRLTHVPRGIYLAGGGSAEDERVVWDSMLSGVSRILYWPVALSGSMLRDAEAWFRASLTDRPRVDITVWLDLAEHEGEEIEGFDLVFVGGGNTFDLQQRIRVAQLGPALHRFLDAGGTYYGGSAGAVIAGESIAIARGLDDDNVNNPDHSGLRLVAGIDVLPHFDSKHIERAERYSAEHPDRTLICIREASGLWLTDRKATVLGPDPIDTYICGSRHARYSAGSTVELRTGT
jgi:dipeptidase E